jgi:hypothetical protein
MIRVLITSYNGARWLPLCIESLRAQTVHDWRAYITDDLSTDDSIAVARDLTGSDGRFEIVANSRKLYQPGNYQQILSRGEIDDDDIVLTLDGDDWLPDPAVFERVLAAYADGQTWITYGSMAIYVAPSLLLRGFSRYCLDVRTARRVMKQFNTGHLRTFKAFLWRHIKAEDLQGPSGNYWEVTGDQAFMFPMLEMAGNARTRFLSEDNYVYNQATALNDNKLNKSRQLEYERLIRRMPVYAELPDRQRTSPFRTGLATGPASPPLWTGLPTSPPLWTGLPTSPKSPSSDAPKSLAYRKRGPLPETSATGSARTIHGKDVTIHVKVDTDAGHVAAASFESDADDETLLYASRLAHLIEGQALDEVRRLDAQALRGTTHPSAAAIRFALAPVEALHHALASL